MDQILMEYDEGMEMAFERCKSWSKYCSQLLSYIQNRLSYEHQHAKSIQKLAEQTKSALASDFRNNNYVPLIATFEEFMSCGDWFADTIDSTIKVINDRVVKTLQQKQQDLDTARKNLKNEFNKQLRHLQKCEKELNQARAIQESSDAGYFKARESTLRSEMSVPTVIGAEQYRKKKEVEKRRKHEEEALHRKTDAEKLVQRLELRLETLKQNLEATKQKNIQKLCEWIYRCDQTTKACASHYFQAFATLWSPVPGKYQDLADATRNYRPGLEYMSFLQNLPGRSVSSASLLRGEKCTDDDAQTTTTYSASASVSGVHMGLGPGDSMSSSSTSTAQRRRNALTAADYETIAETTARRQKKSTGRLFEPTISAEYSEAAKSHKLQRTRQPLRCAHCDHLSLWGEALKCGACGAGWHKKCLSHVNVTCVPSARTVSNRRMSIFGVSLKDHLQHRRVPLILERCIDELQQRGMNVKGIYRTCGVKSKVEQICIMFEQAEKGSDVDLADVHPMNIASVIKLYLRKLPEPLLSYELYQDWLDFEIDCDPGIGIKRLRELVNKLPQQNYETLKHLGLHLKRVTWFEFENLMTASNLAAVIAPSLIWSPTAHTGPSTPASIASGYTTNSTFINDAHQQTRIVELLIKHAFEIFCVDKMEDWKEFFQKYPDLAEPKILDEKSEAQIARQVNIEIIEDEDLEDDDDIDEEPEMGNSSTNTSQQPPTPDLLRNTSNSRNPDGGNEDAEISSTLSSHCHSSPSISSKLTYGTPSYNHADSIEKQRIGKQRSYTTSILVSPQSDRKVILPHKQHSIDGSSKLDIQSPKFSQTLCSGEVTIDIKQGQFFIPNDSVVPNRDRLQLSSTSLRESRNNDLPKYHASSTATTPVSSTNDYAPGSGRFTTDSYEKSRLGERICLQGVGLIFSGTDVSYV
uniref:Uncharacterized protein n=1 Tax=Acrobeloides nanus TaxID=290746 RepID=A0A914E991_9BILA